MPILLRPLGRSSRAISTSSVPVRRVLISFSIESRTVQKQPIGLPCAAAVLHSRWHQQTRLSSSDQKAKALNQQGIDNELSEFDDALEAEKEKQARTPWHREGADQPPVSRPRSAGAMIKGTIFVCSPGRALRLSRKASDHTIQTTKAGFTSDNG